MAVINNAPLFLPSPQNPVYSCVVVTKDGVRYDISRILLQVTIEHQKNQLACRAQVKCVNVKSGEKYLNGLIHVCDRVFLYAHDGNLSDEVFRGVVWEIDYSSKREKELSLNCYDNLIYLQESEDNRYFSSGRDSKSICQAICGDWGIMLDYSYSSITHGKLPLQGRLSDILLSQILAEVRKQTGIRYVMYSAKDIVYIAPAGKNEKIYTLSSQGTVLQTSSHISLDGVVTKVVILGVADEDGQQKIEATVSGDTEQYGTLQKIQTKEKDTSLADAKKEAEQLLQDQGKPIPSYELESVDIPWLRLGDKVEVSAGSLLGSYLIVGISHQISDTKKIMRLTLEDF